MAHTTLSVLSNPDFPEVCAGFLDSQIRRVTEIYDENIPSADFRVENHGSIFLLQPLTEIAEFWVREFLPDVTYFGPAIAVEHRYIREILDAIETEGLAVTHG